LWFAGFVEEPMSGTPKSLRPLHLQTIDSLFAELIGGSSVSVGGNNAEFRLDNADSRAILNWYRLNRIKWSGNVMATDVEAMVSSVTTPPPALPIPEIVVPKPGRRLRLAKLVAHRFAGVHAYGTAEAPPPDFVFEPREPITLFDGWNGAGKTSLLNTVIWCLTGEMLRPQRQPESGQQEFSGLFVRSSVDGNDETTSHTLTPVTPLPNPAVYMPPLDKPVPVDSWVELFFVDQDGNPLPAVRRTQLRTARGKISEVKSGFETLGVDPIALRIGTIMPALLQFLRVGTASDLGLAAAKLTGLADISSLAKHATKARDKLTGEFKKDREGEIKDADTRFLEARGDLRKQIEEYPDMAPPEPLPTPSVAEDLEQKLTGLENHFNALKAVGLTAAQTILGLSFNPADKDARNDLEASIGPAQGQLKSMGQLPNVRRSRALTELGEADWQLVDDLTAQIRAEAAMLAELAATPELGRRKQLYARVASWIGNFEGHDTSSCAVCSRSLDGVVDPVTQRAVSEHLAEVTEAEQELLSLTQQSWANGWAGKLATNCPVALQSELGRDLPAHPRELIRAALVEDLFETDAFSATLAPLKAGVALACDQGLARLPTFTEPVVETLPTALKAVSAPLLLSLKRLARARAFAKWRAVHVADVGEVTKTILQGPSGDTRTITDLTPIGHKLEALASIVKGVAPLNTAIELCQRMVSQLKIRRTKEERLKLYGRTVMALEGAIELGSLAEKQVETLRKLLHTRASYWRNRCYHNSYPMAGHGLRDTAMDVKGVLDIRVGFEKASAPAQHISNASALRASLMGFFLAFWEYVLAERGGIALLIFDDPQELLDHDNKERLARLLPDLVKQGGQLLVATYDRHFARATAAAGREHTAIEHRSVHPVNPSRSRLETAQAVEELDCKRNAYEQDKDNSSRAQDYANEVRIFLEARFADLFDDPAYPAYAAASKAPAFADHLGHLRSLVKDPPNALFKGKAVADVCECKALAQGSECMRVLNTAHHDRASLSAGDVYAVAGDLNLVRKLTEKMNVEFRHWRWHEPLRAAERPNNVIPFKSITAPTFKVSIQPDLAAFTANAAQEATQDGASEMLEASWFADKTLFLVRKNNLGFAVPDGCIAITESNSYDGRDHNLVIARQRGHLLARRLLRTRNGDELALAAEAPDPRESKPTLFFNVGDIVLHRIVGMLTEQPMPPPGSGEASELASASSLSLIKTAYRVREESGIPLALPGQVVLGGDTVSKEQLPSLEGTLIALGLDNGSSIFKRIGKRVPDTGGRLWQFESVGGLGSSMIVSLAEPDEFAEADEKSDATRFVCARRIIGVLYTI
jgi:AAA domain